MDCLIVADDLTGACDAAGPFAARGYASRAGLLGFCDAAEAQVFAVSTDTRDAPPERLPAALRQIAADLWPSEAQILFKKIDSTLRGNVPAEIVAALDVFGCAAAIVTPAFPRMRRVVAGGHLSIAGQPDFAPIHLPSHFRAAAIADCAHAAPSEVLAGLKAGCRLVTVDACTDADLDEIVAAGQAFDSPLLWAGSAGLSSALARGLPLQHRVANRLKRRGTVLFCAGSDHAVTLAQQSALMENCEAALLSAEDATDGEVGAACAHGRPVILRVPRGRVTEKQLRTTLASAGAQFSAILVTGGDTASLLYRALGMRGLAIHGEVAPGIPYSVAAGGHLDGIAIVTKSGGFGATGAFIEVADFFECPKT